MLVTLVEQFRFQLGLSGGIGTTNDEKKSAWGKIADLFRGVGTCTRDKDELLRKKEQWFSKVKAKVRFFSIYILHWG